MSQLSPFTFTQPLLINSYFSARRPKKPDDTINIHLHKNIVKNEHEKSAIVELTVQLNKAGDVENEDPCFVAEVMLQSTFSWPEELEEEKANSLLNINAPALLVSYARPIFANLTSASPFPTYNLPFLNMIEIFKDDQQE